MCEYSGRLIAWTDGELREEEAANVEWHVERCAACRQAVRDYQEVSGAFLDCYEALLVQRKPHLWRWAAALGGLAAAAAVVAVILIAEPRSEKLAFHPPPPPPAPMAAVRALQARSRDVPVPHRAMPAPDHRRWMAEAPVVEVAVPAEALFPPGAVPEGFSLIEEVRFQQ